MTLDEVRNVAWNDQCHGPADTGHINLHGLSGLVAAIVYVGDCIRSRADETSAPPPVCTGSGWPAILVHESTGLPIQGKCGICGQSVNTDNTGRTVTHAYEVGK